MKRLVLCTGMILGCLILVAVLGCKEPVVYTVTYDGNGNTGGEPPVDETGYDTNAKVTVLGNTGNLEKTYHNFGGWSTEADGSGTGYRAGTTFTIGASNATLYADWYYTLLLWETGQTSSYGTDDDAEIQAGVPWPDPRFYDNGDGTITDNLTGLMWQQDGDASGYIEWEPALSYCSDLDLAGYDDWRLPNRKEMLSLLNFEKEYDSNWLNDSGFADIRNDYPYWSSTVVANSTSNIWSYDLSDTESLLEQSWTSDGYVLAVRGIAKGRVHLPKTGQTTSYAANDDGEVQAGVEWPDPRFTDNGDGTVTDHLTKLMWQQNGDATVDLLWDDALAYCNNLTLADYDDWRMPNIIEIESLAHYGKADLETWLNDNGFTNVQNSSYWSATRGMFNPTAYNWHLNISDGKIAAGNLDRRVIAVRSVE